VIRLAPPLIITEAQVGEMVDAFARALDAAAAQLPSDASG